MPEFRPDGIKLIRETVRCIGREDIVGQIEAALVDDRLLSYQIKMISRHAGKTRRREGRSGDSSIAP